MVGYREFNLNGNSDTGGGDLFNFQPDNYLLTPQRRYNIFSSGNYKFGERTRGYFEAAYTNRRSDQKLAAEPVSFRGEGLVISADNIYNPFGRSFNDVSRRIVEAGTRNFLQNIDTFRVVVGMDGQAPKQVKFLADNDWRWDISYNFGRTEGTEVNEGRFVLNRLANAVGPSFVRPDGTFACGTPGDEIDGCVPLNVFGGAGSITQDMIDYVTYTGTLNGFTQQQSVLFTTTGKLADTPWGGDVRLAMGAEYRDQSGGQQPDPNTASGDTTGNKGESTLGSYDVREAYGELSVVPVIGKQGAEWLEFNGAVRAFDYSTFDGDLTWKAGGLWRPIKAVAVRGTFSTAFRAPSIGQLFSGTTDGFPAVTDPCDTSNPDDPPSADEMANCAADGIDASHQDPRVQLRSIVGGNPNLRAETANIFTSGIVVEPPQVKGLAVTVDYFNITIDEAIQPRGAGVILSQCYSVAPDERDMDACASVVRDPVTQDIEFINDTQSNIGGNETAGLDVNIRFDHTTPYGQLRHNLEGTWLQKYTEIQPDGTLIQGKGVYDLGAFPEWKFNYSALWGYQQYGAGFNFRFIGSFKECQDDACHIQFDPENPEPPLFRDVSNNFTMDLFGRYTLKSPLGQSTLSVGVNNFLDQDPAVIYNGFSADSDASTYDYLGRFFYARLLQQF
jgi:outer membrane receptor protein involved in Fe transport